MGIRLVDTSDKSAPLETAFYLPNGNESAACKQDCGSNTRQTWGSYFGSDGRIYASDLGRGFFIVEERARSGASGAAFAGRLPSGGVSVQKSASAHGSTDGARLRAISGFGAEFAFSLTISREGPARIAVYDIQGRLVSAKNLGVLPAGQHSVSWTPRAGKGGLPSRGIYFARVESGEGAATIKFVH